MKKRENLINLIIVILVIVIVCLLGYKLITKNKQEKYDYIKNINISELKEKIDNKDSFILVITQDSCSHCKAFLPVINDVAKTYNITIYDISQTNLSDEDSTYLKNIASISGTPTTVFIVDGVEKTTTNRLVGNVPKYRVIEHLKALGYINE